MNKSEEHIMKFELDLQNLPPLTAEQEAELKSLAMRPDAEIDYTDAPLVQNMRLYRAKKEMTTVRIDADVLAWLRSQGKGYQTRINAILRNEMLRTTARAKQTA